MRSVWALVGGVAATVMGVAAAFGAPPGLAMAPHQATYRMSLASTQPGSGIVGADGTMSYRFADTCDGWTVENRIDVTYAYSEGGQAQTSSDFVTWESKDGLRYRFRVRNARDGQVTDEIEGTAELRGRGQGGVARFTRPEAVTVVLPKGTLFPTEHTVRLMDAARAGEHSLLKVVFDGSDDQGPYDVNALIGRSSPQQENPASPLLDSPSWPMSLAFFPVGGKDSAPDFEMRLLYHANGVAQDILQSFKTFSLRGQLETIEALPRRGC